MGQQQKRFDHGSDAMLRIAADRLLEVPQHMLPDQLRIAAVAIIARGRQFFVEQLRQFQAASWRQARGWDSIRPPPR